MKSARTTLSKLSMNELLMPCAKTATKTTTPRPIISAEAVAAVRPGFLTLLSRARRPLTGAIFCRGQPSRPASGLMRYLLTIARAMNTSTAPTATVPSRDVVLPGPYMPATIPSAPSTATAAAKYGLKRANRDGGSTAPSCRAAMGGTRVARVAGITAESRVTMMPTASATMTVRGASTSPLCGMSIFAAAKSLRMPAAIPRPARMPSTEARTPIASASPAIVTSTWRREAPSARSIANSRRRCATVIENALKMMNAPTSTAMPPNDRSIGRRKLPMASLSCLVWSVAACVPVFTSV